MNYWQYTIRTEAPETAEVLLAFLTDSPIESFQENEQGFCAFLQTDSPAQAEEAVTLEVEATLKALQEDYAFTWEKAFLPSKNWNELWEKNFSPVMVGDFCVVRADFHEPMPGFKYELVINPKMAFGTGHHETTYGCLEAMAKLPITGARILDFGCGTGILSLLAAKLGALHIDAVDIEEEAYRSTLENIDRNQTSQIQAWCGQLDAVPPGPYDGVLANINRNVILDALPQLAERVVPGGWLLVSGILEKDLEVVAAAAEQVGFRKVEKREQARDWVVVEFRRE
jgi:ribosomal protein L11 methyltransferase